MNITAFTVFVALVGFAIAAGPALVVILMDLGKEQHAKALQQQSVSEHLSTTTDGRQLVRQ
jgi:hypothetical protein